MPSWAVRVDEAPFSSIKKTALAREAEERGAPFKNTVKTKWFGAYVEGKLIGACSVVPINVEGTRFRFFGPVLDYRWRMVGARSALIYSAVAWVVVAGGGEVVSDDKKVQRIIDRLV